MCSRDPCRWPMESAKETEATAWTPAFRCLGLEFFGEEEDGEEVAEGGGLGRAREIGLIVKGGCVVNSAAVVAAAQPDQLGWAGHVLYSRWS
jgi:hypothetical protein